MTSGDVDTPNAPVDTARVSDAEKTSFQVQSYVHRTARGELRLSTPAPTVFVFEYQGFSDGSFIPFIEDVWDATFPDPRAPLQVFSDTERQTGYTTEFRTRLMPWSQRVISLTDTFVLLVKSRWVAMGIAIGTAALGARARHVEVTAKRAVFQTKLDEAVRRALARG